jgi:hypothetical protein
LLLACTERARSTGGDAVAPMHPDALSGLPSMPLDARPLPEASPQARESAPSSSGSGTPSFGVPPYTQAAAMYRVEPGTQYASLASVASLLKPGDIVDVVGDATYAGGVRFDRDGRDDAKIVIRGVTKNGKRPVVSGGQNTIEAAGDHYVFENLDITGGAKRCFYHHANEIVLRSSFIHDCPQQGILGGDTDAGSLTVEFCELARCGGGVYHHQIYMATDEKAHPGSVFRLLHSYIHDGAGGNNVKSRAERNEILYNWIEGALYHEVELVGPDGQDPKLAREDGQIVGNVLYKVGAHNAIRLGGDGTGATAGRYRLVGNTIIMASNAGAIRLMDSVESVELYNNAFYRTGTEGVVLFKDDEVKWATGKPVIAGQNNWFSAGSTTSTALKGTKMGGGSVFAGLATKDLRPGRGSPLAAAGTASTPTDATLPFPNPLAIPAFEPPMAKVGPPKARPATLRPSIGAFEP